MLHSPKFRTRFIALSAILEKPLPTYTFDRLQTLLTERIIAEQLIPMLASAVKPDSRALLEKAWTRAVSLVSIQAHEEEYVKAVHHGELRLELLFAGDAVEVARLSQHPAIQWKIKNARSHRLKNNPDFHVVPIPVDKNEA